MSLCELCSRMALRVADAEIETAKIRRKLREMFVLKQKTVQELNMARENIKRLERNAYLADRRKIKKSAQP